MAPYTHDFYANRDSATRYAAETILGLLLTQIPPVRSAIDIGCGVGTWLSVLTDTHGVTVTQGHDGDWVERDLLEIPQDCFEPLLLSKEMPAVTRRYDLAISLEVAEHLPSERAADFVKYLTELSDTVLFSAAIPGQGGTGHVNEQWPSYWAELFGELGYRCVDEIRSQIWKDEKIPVWYRQNVLLFERRGVLRPAPLDIVHPELFLAHVKPGVKGSFKTFREAVRAYIAH